MNTILTKTPIDDIDQVIIGGAKIARMDMEQTGRLMMRLAREPTTQRGPFYLTSANGEVLARRFFDPAFRKIFDDADLINADGQPLVFASRIFRRTRLPERVASTDLYPIVARMAQEEAVSIYLFGASEEANLAAVNATRRAFPTLDIRGHCHGYYKGDALERKLDEINALAPDILWLALGVPLEQEFVRRNAHRLPNVKMIKTAGGLFDFVAGAKKRAPTWMQWLGLEWAFRLYLEPRRLARRYLTTNPIALMLLLTQTRRG